MSKSARKKMWDEELAERKRLRAIGLLNAPIRRRGPAMRSESNHEELGPAGPCERFAIRARLAREAKARLL